jgi:hypothetical protein
MTMEEVNRTINRIDIDQAGTLSKKNRYKKYNINYNLIILGLNKSGYKLILSDTIPDVTITNSKGYYIDIKDNKRELHGGNKRQKQKRSKTPAAYRME